MQLVFGRDANLNMAFKADWHRIQQQKQKTINKNKLQENKKHTPHKYKVGDNILIKKQTNEKIGGNPYSEPV